MLDFVRWVTLSERPGKMAPFSSQQLRRAVEGGDWWPVLGLAIDSPDSFNDFVTASRRDLSPRASVRLQILGILASLR